jgi:hypothetical protein
MAASLRTAHEQSVVRILIFAAGLGVGYQIDRTTGEGAFDLQSRK